MVAVATATWNGEEVKAASDGEEQLEIQEWAEHPVGTGEEVAAPVLGS